MSNSMRLHRWQPTRLPRPWDSPSKNTGVGCHFLLQCMKVKSESCVRLLATPWTAAHQAPPSMGFSRQEYWSGVPSPSLWPRGDSAKYMLTCSCAQHLAWVIPREPWSCSWLRTILPIPSLILTLQLCSS